MYKFPTAVFEGNYSWPQSSSVPRTLLEDMGPCSPDSLNLVIPHPSADGASLNDEGRRMAERLGYFIKKRCQERGDDKPYIFTSTLPRIIALPCDGNWQNLQVELISSTEPIMHLTIDHAANALNPVDVRTATMPVGDSHACISGGSLSWYDDGRNPTNAGTRAARRIRLVVGNATGSDGNAANEEGSLSSSLARRRISAGTRDVTKRLEPFIVDYLERQVSPVIVISHLSTLQVAQSLSSLLLTFVQILYEYFLGTGDSKGKPFWALDMPVGTVIQLVAKFGGASAGVSWQETRFQLYDDSILDHACFQISFHFKILLGWIKSRPNTGNEVSLAVLMP
eukprot:553064-Hanusia_phi.AAC.3